MWANPCTSKQEINYDSPESKFHVCFFIVKLCFWFIHTKYTLNNIEVRTEFYTVPFLKISITNLRCRVPWGLFFFSIECWCFRIGLICIPDPNIIWVCESPAIILYSDVAIFPRFGGKRDVTHLIYVKIKPYLISLLFLAKMAWFQTFPSTKSKRRN